jgi:hypothetical protein
MLADEVAGERFGAGLSSGLPLSAAQPQPVDQRGETVAGLLACSRGSSRGTHTRGSTAVAAADLLQAIEHRLMHAAGPEGQPGLHRRAAYLAVIEVAADDGLQAFSRAGRACRRLNTASRSWPVMSRMVASSRPFYL